MNLLRVHPCGISVVASTLKEEFSSTKMIFHRHVLGLLEVRMILFISIGEIICYRPV